MTGSIFAARAMYNIAVHGWQVTHVDGDGDEPSFSYTTGLTADHRLELIVDALSPLVAHYLLNRLAGMRNLASGTTVLGMLGADGEFAVQLFDVPDLSDMSITRMVYGACFPALAVVIPDTDGRWPWDTGFALQRYPNRTHTPKDYDWSSDGRSS